MPTGDDIQIEKGNPFGFTQIHNLLYKMILRSKLGLYEKDILHALIRLIYGFKTTERNISREEIQEETGIDLANISRTIKSLIARNIISVTGGGKGRGDKPLIKINKYFEYWKVEFRYSPETTLSEPERYSPETTLSEPERYSPETTLSDVKVVCRDTERYSVETTFISLLNKGNKEEDTKKEVGREVSREKTITKPTFNQSKFVEAYTYYFGYRPESPLVADWIQDCEEEFTLLEFKYALSECVRQNKRVWSYLKGVIRGVREKKKTGWSPPVEGEEKPVGSLAPPGKLSGVADFSVKDLDL